MDKDHPPNLVRELRPHAAWKAIEWIGDRIINLIGAAVIASGIGIAAWLRGHLDIITLATAFVLSALVFTRLTKSGRSRGGSHAPPLKEQELELLPELLPTIPEKLTIEIVKGVIGTYSPEPLWSMQETLILLKIRVSGNSYPDVTIKNWKLRLHSMENGIPNQFPTTAEIKELTESVTYTVKGGIFGIGNRLDVLTRSSPIRHGIATEGWILFNYYNDPHIVFGKVLEVVAMDDLGGESNLVKYPGEWAEPTEFKKESTPLLAPSLMPPPR